MSAVINEAVLEPSSSSQNSALANAGQVCSREDFDEDFYLATHADIKRGVDAKTEKSGYNHYIRVGRKEGRQARIASVDPVFYLKSYPLARREIENGPARDPADHYARLGRARGYIPNGSAARKQNPSAPSSRFGGLWTDAANALDLIDGKMAVGMITEQQAELLRFWVEHGYVRLPAVLSKSEIATAREVLEAAYSGQMTNVLFECGAVTGDARQVRWQQDFNDHPAKALDIHFQSRAVRDVIFSKPISDFLALIFENRALASQSLGFWRGSAQAGHQDTAYVAYTQPRNFAASWIALEDVTPGAGELFYFDRSHLLEDFLYGGSHKTIHDCKRMNNGSFPKGEAAAFLQSLKDRTDRLGLEKLVFNAKAGDVLIWHADLVHGGNPVSKDVTRKSVVTHYCPIHSAPLYFEGRQAMTYKHGDHEVSTSVYIHSKPGD